MLFSNVCSCIHFKNLTKFIFAPYIYGAMVLYYKRVILWRIFLKKLITKRNLYRIKECVDEFEYKFKDTETEKIKKFKITEKRIVTFNPKLAKKQIYEINKEVGKAKLLKASQAKRSEYGDSAKYVIFTTTDKKGNDTNGKIKVTMNEDRVCETFSVN